MPVNSPIELQTLIWTLVHVALVVLPVAFLAAVYIVLTLPLRRKERARLFLDIVEIGMADGLTPERVVVQAATTRDRVLGARFYQVASYVESGMKLTDALGKIPRFLPPEINAMLRVGDEVGDLRRVLPACRQLLADALSQTRGALNYVMVLAFILMPMLPAVMAMTSIFILPKFNMIAQDIGSGMPAFSNAVFAARVPMIMATIVLMVFFQLLIVFYAAGPRGRDFTYFPRIEMAFDRLLWMLPWRRNRLKRDFSAMLAVTLDAGLPEARAVKLAAASTANHFVMRRAESAIEKLAAGVKLTETLALIDGERELQWRMTNAGRSRVGFFDTLRGWMQTLDARAFQQEQAAAQVMTTALVIVNGALIGVLVVAMFLVLIRIAEEAPLW